LVGFLTRRRALAAALFAVVGLVQAAGMAPAYADRPATRAEWSARAMGAVSRVVPPPREAIKQGLSGRVEVRIEASVTPDGTVSAARVTRSSGHDSIDQLALRGVNTASPLPAFSPDMGKAPKTVVLPIVFELGAPRTQSFHDAETGLAFTVPPPLVLGKRRGHPGHDFVIEVDSTELPRAGTSKSLCGVGLKTQPDEVQALDQATLSSPDMVDETLESMRLTLGMMGRVDAIVPIAFGGGVRGVAAVTTPRLGPDHDKVRQYIAIAETPAYRISLSCATTAAAIDRARPLFEALLGSMRIEPAP
jgi:TonB family protein